jgi:phasin family protein
MDTNPPELAASPTPEPAVPAPPVPAPTVTVVEAVPPEPVQAVPAPKTYVAARFTIPNLTQGMKTMINKTEDFVAIGKDNLEAITTSGKIWAAGVQDISTQLAATAKASLEETVAAFKAMTSVKSVREAIDLQATYSKNVVAKALAESSKLTEASLKLTEQAIAPLTARVAVAVESFSKAA